MKKTIFISLLATSLFSCNNDNESKTLSQEIDNKIDSSENRINNDSLIININKNESKTSIKTLNEKNDSIVSLSTEEINNNINSIINRHLEGNKSQSSSVNSIDLNNDNKYINTYFHPDYPDTLLPYKSGKTEFKLYFLKDNKNIYKIEAKSLRYKEWDYVDVPEDEFDNELITDQFEEIWIFDKNEKIVFNQLTSSVTCPIPSCTSDFDRTSFELFFKNNVICSGYLEFEQGFIYSDFNKKPIYIAILENQNNLIYEGSSNKEFFSEYNGSDYIGIVEFNQLMKEQKHPSLDYLEFIE